MEPLMTASEENLLQTASELLQPFIKQNKNFLGGREGACLALLDKTITMRKDIVRFFDLGEIPLNKIMEKRAFAKERVLRVSSMNNGHGHITSFESESPDNEQHGGGIQVRDGLFVSLSGFPAYIAQDFLILVGLFSYEMTLKQATEIRKRTIDKYPGSFFTGR